MPSLGSLASAAVIGLAIIIIAFICLTQLEETYGKNLDYVETV
jgi:hypothetical protein